jgi:MoaA/NifB/PqqE/SkfB family radical SAM enzyme
MTAELPSLTPDLPAFAQIEPVGRCNLACKMCTVNERGDAVAEMALERYTALLDQLPGLRELHLQGLGEPMLHPAFFDMVALAPGARGARSRAALPLAVGAALRQCRSCALYHGMF